MRIITKKRLIEFGNRHPGAKEPLSSWYHIVSKRDFVHFADLRTVFRTVDVVGKLTVFNIAGNKYRLIVSIHYNRRIVYIRQVLTHSEYNAGKWKE
ncbi:MAG: type II toxin-antitoxin system HigB family toxin [Nitrospirae bacterium]|nr:type II toxin-antitoxin system HigB family toxin [Nitrospirota bacterium]